MRAAQMLLPLSTVSLAVLQGCVVDCPDCVTRKELDDAVAAAIQDKGCVTAQEAATTYVDTTDLADALAGYVTMVDAEATYATVNQLAGYVPIDGVDQYCVVD